MYLVNFSRLAFGAIAIAACPFSSAAKAENLGQATRLMLAQDKRFLFEYSYTQRSEEMPDSDIGKRQRLLPRISGVSTINDIIPPIQIIPIAFPAPPAVPVLPPANPVVLVVPRATQLRQVSESHSASATAKVTKHFGMSLKSSYVRKQMTSGIFLNGARVTTYEETATGWGDTQLSVFWKQQVGSSRSAKVETGISLPTGRTDVRSKLRNSVFAQDGINSGPGILNFGPLPFDNRPLLPISMQLGSGTYDLMLGTEFAADFNRVSAGVAFDARFRTGEAQQVYKLGDNAFGKGWVSYQLLPWLNATAHASGYREDSINLIDPTRHTVDRREEALNSGRTVIETGLGLEVVSTEGILRGQGLSIEYSLPVYQRTKGVQMEREDTLAVRWSYFR